MTQTTLPNPILKYYEFDQNLHGKYFHQGELKAESLKLKCALCAYEKLITGSCKVTSNWITHIKTAHSKEYNEYQETVATIKSKKNQTAKKVIKIKLN